MNGARTPDETASDDESDATEESYTTTLTTTAYKELIFVSSLTLLVADLSCIA